jgi:hypothetical protein
VYYNDTNINHNDNKFEGKHPEVNITGIPVCSFSVKFSLFMLFGRRETYETSGEARTREPAGRKISYPIDSWFRRNEPCV